jgi:glutamyl-tRNA reductase
MVAQEAETFLAWWRSLDSVPVIAALRRRAEELRHAEVSRTLRIVQREAGPMPPEELARRLDAMSQALVNKLLHQPTVRLKALDSAAQQALARQLFDLDGGSLGGGNGSGDP